MLQWLFDVIYVPAVMAAVEDGELCLHELEHGAAACRFEVAGASVRARLAGGLGGQGREGEGGEGGREGDGGGEGEGEGEGERGREGDGEGEGENSVRVSNSTQYTVHSTHCLFVSLFPLSP